VFLTIKVDETENAKSVKAVREDGGKLGTIEKLWKKSFEHRMRVGDKVITIVISDDLIYYNV